MRSAALFGVLVLLSCSCHSGRTQPSPTPVVSSVPLTSSVPPARGRQASVPRVERLFDDATFASMRVFDADSTPAKSAQLLADARKGGEPPKPRTSDARCALAYAEARRWIAADRAADASEALLVATEATCPLRDYAKTLAAEVYLRAHEPARALAALPLTPPKAIAPEVELLRADALLAEGAKPEAGRLYRAWLTSHTRGPRYGEIAVRFADIGLGGGFTPSEPWAELAFTALTRTMVDFPRWADKANVGDLLMRVATAANRPTTLSAVDRVKRAQGLLDGATGERARAELRATAEGAPSDAACKAAIALANAQKKADKSDGWEFAIQKCAKDEELPVALYNGAKDASKRKDELTALARYARVEQEFAAHRLADDARLRSALLYRDRGDEARFVSSLASLPATYPDGDMKEEARFRLALHHAEQKRWGDVATTLDPALEGACKDRHWASAGRIEFFRARAAELSGEGKRARELYAHLVEERTLYFYGLRAHARLRAIDGPAADHALDSARSRGAAWLFPPESVHEDLASAETERALALLSIEEIEPAKRELAARSKSPEWATIAGHWLNEAGAFDAGHAFARSGNPPFLDTFPHGGSRHAWEAAYPAAFASLVETESLKNGVPKSLVWSIMREESDFIADAKSHSNAIGLMQFMLPTAKWIATGTGLGSDETALKRPEVAVALGARYLSKLRSQFGRESWLAIPAYNSGKGAVDRWLAQMGTLDFETFVEKIPYDETRNYTKRVLMSQAVYAALYEQSALREVLELGATWPSSR